MTTEQYEEAIANWEKTANDLYHENDRLKKEIERFNSLHESLRYLARRVNELERLRAANDE
jgi:hypothetical protein